MLKASRLCASVLAVATFTAAASAQDLAPGVTDSEIVIGNTMPYSGPASAYGVIGEVMSAYFEMINEQGGVNGRRIVFISYDDGAVPPRTLEQTRRLVERDGVHFIFGSLGINQNIATREYLNDRGIPQLLLSGAIRLFDDPQYFPWTMRWNPSAYAEAQVLGQYIEDSYPDAIVGVLYQNDPLGADYLEGLASVLDADRIIAEPYDLTDPTVDAQVAALRDRGATVFANLSTPRAAAQAIRRAAEIGWNAPMLLANISSSVEGVLAPAGIENAIGAVNATALKDPSLDLWADDPGVEAVVAFIEEYYPEGDPRGTFEAYAYGISWMMTEVLRRSGDDLSRANILSVAQSLQGVVVPTALPGITADTSPTDHAPLEQFRLARFDGTAFVPFGPIYDTADY